MRGFSILMWCIVTALTFYSAWRFKAPHIENDIITRVSESVNGAGARNVDIEVDGRHVNLRGFVTSPSLKETYLSRADNTHGALGPVDGLVLPQAPIRTFLSASSDGDNVVLSGVVGTEDERDMLLNHAKKSGLSNVIDDLTVSGENIGWSVNAQDGFAQLANLKTGHLYVSDDRNALSGHAPTVDVATAAASMGDNWTAFVEGPQLEDPRIGELQNRLADRDAALAELVGQNNDLTAEIASLQTSISSAEAQISSGKTLLAGLQTELVQKKAHIKLLQRETKANAVTLSNAQNSAQTQTVRIEALEAELAAKTALASDLETQLANSTGQLAVLRENGGDQVANLETSLAEQSAEVKELEAELVALSTSKGRTIDELNAQLATLSDEKAELSQRLEKQEASLTTANQAKDADLNDAQKSISDLQAQLAAANEKLGNTDEARIMAVSKSDNLEALLNDSTSKVSSLSQEIAALKGQLSDFEQTQAKLGVLQTQATEKDVKIAALMQDLENKPEPSEVQSVAQCNQTAQSLLEEGKINFVSSSAEILEASQPLLERITGVVLACSGAETGASVTVAGHTDSSGSEASNQELSEARAASVAQFMIDRGVDPKALAPIGLGETAPIADNETEEGRAANRRISFDFQAR